MVTNLLRFKLQKYSSYLSKQVIKSKLSKQDFNRNLPKADKYNILTAGVLYRILAAQVIVILYYNTITYYARLNQRGDLSCTSYLIT